MQDSDPDGRAVERTLLKLPTRVLLTRRAFDPFIQPLCCTDGIHQLALLLSIASILKP